MDSLIYFLSKKILYIFKSILLYRHYSNIVTTSQWEVHIKFTFYSYQDPENIFRIGCRRMGWEIAASLEHECSLINKLKLLHLCSPFIYLISHAWYMLLHSVKCCFSLARCNVSCPPAASCCYLRTLGMQLSFCSGVL